jgi:hypothetical protein
VDLENENPALTYFPNLEADANYVFTDSKKINNYIYAWAFLSQLVSNIVKKNS